MSQSNSKASSWKPLMLKAQGGDKEAYSLLLRQVQPILRAFIGQRIPRGFDADDVLQEVLMGMHRNLRTFRAENSFEAWMFSIARYKIIDYIRRKQRRGQREVLQDEVVEKVDIGDGEEEIFSELELALAKLPERQRRIVTKMKLEEQSVRQVAEQEGMSESAVRVAAHRAYKWLRQEILRQREHEEAER